jgi:hypothetical protein
MLEEAARRAGATNGAPASVPWPPPLFREGETIDETRTRLAALRREIAVLEARERRLRFAFSLEDGERLHAARNMADSLESHVRLADRMERAP